MSGRSPRRRRPTLGIPVPPACREMIERGTLVALNVSGGKDSQAMGLLLARSVPHEQLVAVHAPLGELEWPGTIEHIQDTIPPGVPLILAPVASGKTLLQCAEERGKFPGPRQRWCTGDFKSSPIARELRRYRPRPVHALREGAGRGGAHRVRALCGEAPGGGPRALRGRQGRREALRRR